MNQTYWQSTSRHKTIRGRDIIACGRYPYHILETRQLRPLWGDVTCKHCLAYRPADALDHEEHFFRPSEPGDKDWGETCISCGELPTVYPTSLCGPCCLEDPTTKGGRW